MSEAMGLVPWRLVEELRSEAWPASRKVIPELVAQARPVPVEPERSPVDRQCRHPACETKGSYRLNGSCTNCGTLVQGAFTRGHEASGGRCPGCGCETLAWRRGLVPWNGSLE